MSKTGLAIAGRTEGTRFPTFEVYQLVAAWSQNLLARPSSVSTRPQM